MGIGFILSSLIWCAAALSPGPPAYRLPDLAGKEHTQAELREAKATAFLFIATECPISNRYAPEIGRIVDAYARREVAFMAVHSDPEIKAEDAARHASAYGYRFPVLLDPGQTLARQLDVQATPTVVVLSPAGEPLYRGRIDNRYLDFGKYRDAGIHPDLRLALDAILAGRPVAEPVTKSIGCGLPPLPRAPNAK